MLIGCGWGSLGLVIPVLTAMVINEAMHLVKKHDLFWK